MEKWQLLLADEEQRIVTLETSAFPAEQFQIISTVSYEEAWHLFQKQAIQLVICEWNDGELLRRIRQITEIPVIIVSSSSQEKIRIKAFQSGADDFIAKPFNVEELRLRAERLLRYFYQFPQRSQQIERYRYAYFDLDKVHRTLEIHNKRVPLTAREFDLLTLFVQTPKKIYSRKECLQKIWHYTYFGEERVVDQCIRSIREKLTVYSDTAAQSIVTVWKKGYLFDPEKMK